LEEDVAGLEDKIKDLNKAVQQLAFDLERVKEHECHEREKIVLTVENTLLRYERMLASAEHSRKRK